MCLTAHHQTPRAQLLVQRCNSQVGLNIRNIQQKQEPSGYSSVLLLKSIPSESRTTIYQMPTPLKMDSLIALCAERTMWVCEVGAPWWDVLKVLGSFVPFSTTFPGKSKQRLGHRSHWDRGDSWVCWGPKRKFSGGPPPQQKFPKSWKLFQTSSIAQKSL